MNCNDCGIILTAENQNHSSRREICSPCWDTRMELVAGKIVPLGSDLFKAIQKKMAGRQGTAKRLIDSLRETTP